MSGDETEEIVDKSDSHATEPPETTTEHVHFKDAETFMQDGFKILVEATRHANALPKDREYDFYSTHESFSGAVSCEADRILGLINGILRRSDVDGNIKNRTLDERVEMIVEANDAILERVATTIDDMNGLRKLPAQPVIQTVSAELPVSGSWNKMRKFSVNSTQGSVSNNSIHLLAAKNIIRPQKFFRDKIENSTRYPWHPRIKDKPNSLKPLALFLEETERGEEYSHPYEIELDRFLPPVGFLKECVLQKPKEPKDTPLHEITTPEQLDGLVEELRRHKMIAVDVEHHSYRTFMGITCLLQISTSEEDYLVDTLLLRDKLHVLNEVFTKNSIVKIFHGADMDVQWLQRDLSLYIVNMFDTHRAAKQLGYSGLSLSYLLNRFCSVLPNKQFQLADWRIRPLPEQLKSYAREDTHYLIYIFQKLTNELLTKANGKDNLLKAVYQASTDVCRKRYFKPRLTESSHLDFYRKCKRSFDNRQMYALKELYGWRDCIAREEDESTGYVLPNHMLLQISEMLPREIQGILACCNPIPPLVRANSLELHQIILRAREQPLEKLIMKDDSRSCTQKETTRINVDSPLHCPHDLTKLQEFRDDLPTLLGAIKTPRVIDLMSNLKIEKQKSSCSVFASEDKEENDVKRMTNMNFLGPYERYKMIKPFIQAEEKKARELAELKNSGGVEDDPSVEDRIAALHEHFVKVKTAVEQQKVRQPIEGVPPDTQEAAPEYPQPLITMGGSKKRKRDRSEEDYSHHPHYEEPENQLHTTVPSFSRHGESRDRGDAVQTRNWYDGASWQGGQGGNRGSPTKYARGGKGAARGKSDDHLVCGGRGGRSRGSEQSPSKRGGGDRSADRGGHGRVENRGGRGKSVGYSRAANSGGRGRGNRGSSSQGRARGGSADRGGAVRSQDYRESDATYNQTGFKRRNCEETEVAPRWKKPKEAFQSFDYSQVDYGEFHGGARGASHGAVRQNFRGKDNKKNFRWNNKSMTFGNAGGSRRGRGR